MAETVVQLAVFMKNVPGTLHEVLHSFQEAGINIEGIMVNDAADHAVVRMVVDSPTRALHILGDRGMLVVESDIVAHSMPNRPGQLKDLAGELARGDINIAYIYGSALDAKAPARIFLHSSDDEKVIRLLGGKAGGEEKAEAGGKGGGKAPAPRKGPARGK